MALTTNQKLAIDIRDANILVSAAAGSGKTSVLVERIVGRITQSENPIDIDRLLIMTFTNAAAAEMQSRIRDLIDTYIDEARLDPDADKERLANLERQSLLVHNAMITTIHGFCKSVITEHFEKLSMDPSFRVADENESKLLRQDALDICLEEAYQKADPAFIQASECLSGGKSDTGLSDIIIPLYEFVMADPDPEVFMERICEAYMCDSCEEFENTPLIRGFERGLLDRIRNLKNIITKAQDLIDEYEVLEPYRANIEAYLGTFTVIEDAVAEGGTGIYDITRQHVTGLSIPSFGRIDTRKLGACEAEAKAEVTRLRDVVKNSTGKLAEMLTFSLKDAYEHASASRGVIDSLMDIVRLYGSCYNKIKRDKNVIDFSDMEHMAVQVLSDPDTAELYRDRFVEIYVDEYQDSNLIQEHLVSLICRHDPGNVFQVGDVKQSIYRFRQARPDLFLGKYNTYSDTGADNRRILLNDNFRSRREVTQAVNEVFTRIMKADFGGIEYDESARLNYGATYYDDEKSPARDTYRTELLIGRRDELSAEEFEANVIAKRIAAMVRGGFPVYDRKAKTIRPASFGDFTILVRSIKKYESPFRDVFAGANIPLAVAGREGYFGTTEVQTTLAFLAAVDNPLCDIPLATLARCPVGGFSDRDLATLSAAYGNKICLYERIVAAAEPEPDDRQDNESIKNRNKKVVTVDEKLRAKCRQLLDLLHHYQVMSTYTPVHDILADFIDRHYGDFVKCMNKGPQRMANLSMLLCKAEDYGKTSFTGLYQFNRYMDQIRKYSIDDGEAATVSENDDVVRMMTMHASKGLEFPIIFLAGLEKKRNTTDESGKIIWSADKGIGIDYTDLDRRIMWPTLPKLIVREDNTREAVAEEMRILYVAMTRAREKLIMVGCDTEEEFGSKPKLPENFTSYLDMIKSAYSQGGFEHIDISYVSEEDLVTSRVDEDIRQRSTAEELREIVKKMEGSPSGESGENHESANTSERPDDFAFIYPYPIYPDLKAKLSVSELKHRAMEEAMAAEEAESNLPPMEARSFEFAESEGKYIPKFMRREDENSAGGTFYGTAFHRIMELWDYTGYSSGSNRDSYKDGQPVTSDDVIHFANEMHDRHRISKAEADAIKPDDVAYFLNSPLGKRMGAAAEAGVLYREQPFVIGVPDRGETVLIQGIIDAYFIEDDGITIVDYKTDRVSDEEVLIKRYKEQLVYYGRALSQITGNCVKALTIYSTALGREIVIE